MRKSFQGFNTTNLSKKNEQTDKRFLHWWYAAVFFMLWLLEKIHEFMVGTIFQYNENINPQEKEEADIQLHTTASTYLLWQQRQLCNVKVVI